MSFSSYTIKKPQDIAREFSVSPATGLSVHEASARLLKNGPNTLEDHTVLWWHILIRQFHSSFIYLLFIASVADFFLGELVDSVMIFFFILLNAFLGFFQEYRSEKTIQLLKNYVVSRARVRRGGKEELIESKNIVPGDIVLLEAGDKVPADARIIEDNNLAIDESSLTGESLFIRKNARSLRLATDQAYQASNIVFSGTSVLEGRAACVVFATGARTTFGDIARLTSSTNRTSTFEKGIARLSSFILKLVSGTLLLVFAANLFIKGERADVVVFIIFSIALAVSVIPEVLPTVMTFSLSRGARRLAKNKVVVKRLSAIEDLGGVEILCTDKTGTLTENILTVNDACVVRSDLFISAAAAASHPRAHKQHSINAFDRALLQHLSRAELKKIHDFERMEETPFDPIRRRNTVLVGMGGAYELIVRGAPETVLALCKSLRTRERKEYTAWFQAAGTKGNRVIAVAKKKLRKMPHDLRVEERGLELCGFISFVDPLKKSTKHTLALARELGVQVKVLTGDSKEVAGAVAYQVGLIAEPSDVITGEAFEALSVHDQTEAAQRYHVFARVSPQQKYSIIAVLQGTGKEVGFLGEGMNDAPALKIANVALVVNDAADIAREAADIVLLKKSLDVIVEGIREGRVVFANSIKYIRATLASNFGNFYAMAISTLFIDFLPMLPLQILLVNLLSDFPMMSIATDHVDSQELQKPKSYQVKDIAFFATVLGLVSTIFDFIFFAIFSRMGQGILYTNWFIASILTELVFLFSVRTNLPFYRSHRPSGTVLWLSFLAMAATIAIPFTQWGSAFFSFERPQPVHLFIIFMIIPIYFAVSEIVKLWYIRHMNNQQSV